MFPVFIIIKQHFNQVSDVPTMLPISVYNGSYNNKLTVAFSGGSGSSTTVPAGSHWV